MRTSPASPVVSPCALERDFPAAALSVLAEAESWRKEVHRPATHTHKWWAQRLGTVFRGILTAAVTPDGASAEAAYRDGADLSGVVVLDQMGGSGTTAVEAAKLGATPIVCDINPVATLVQRQALAKWDPLALDAAYRTVEVACRDAIDELHRTATGEPVLYYFWVAQADCPTCAVPVDLFSSYIFARHAYASRYPRAQASCPVCAAVVEVKASDTTFTCGACGHTGPTAGPVKGQWMTCGSGHRHKVVDALAGEPPRHRMYAKLVWAADGRREYRPIDAFDEDLYAQAEKALVNERETLVLPTGELEDGYNTAQALRWGYRRWEQFFNARQLYSLGRLGAAIRDLPASAEREALAALFSGTLEFNNVFCSYKGEGTGAVRHMFSHHVLKPERLPLEAHPWGTPESSGSFSTLFQSRLIRALKYKQRPHDLVLVDGKAERVFGVSRPPGGTIASSAEELPAAGAYVRLGDASRLDDLPDGSVHVAITDPPFMDNVHYSELADFFHAWLGNLQPFDGYPAVASTRHTGEVQSTSPEAFGAALGAVWAECARVLRADGLLAFTFHQARTSGWLEVVRGLRAAGFVVTAVQPVKAEMSVGTPKSGAAEPSNLDSIVVCRLAGSAVPPHASTPAEAATAATERLVALAAAGITVSRTDVRSVVTGSMLALHTDTNGGFAELDALVPLLDDAVEAACAAVAQAVQTR